VLAWRLCSNKRHTTVTGERLLGSRRWKQKPRRFGRGLAVSVGVHTAGNFRRNNLGYVLEETMTCAAKSCCGFIQPSTPDRYLRSSRAVCTENLIRVDAVMESSKLAK
jgi:hypothetical protein